MRCMDVDDFIALTKFDGLRRLIPVALAQLYKGAGIINTADAMYLTVCCYCSFLSCISA